MQFSLILNLILLPLLIAFAVSVTITPLVIFIYKKFGWVEDPKNVKNNKATHLYPVPRGGGIPIYLAIFAGSLLLLPLDRHLLGILIGATIFMVMGVLDDRYDLNPYLRFGINLLAAGVVVGSGIGISYFTNPLGGTIHLDQPRLSFFLAGRSHEIWILADLFAIVWIFFLANAVNWSKGFDGQLPGMMVIATLVIAGFSLRYSADITQWPVVILATITAGAYLGFLPYNFFPQKIMPGYGGGTLGGFMIAVLTILSTSKVLIAAVVLGIPIADALYQGFRRIIAGHSPFWGDRGHLHHKILDEWHWGKRRAAIFYWLVTAILGILALSLNSQQKFYTIIMLFVLVGGLFLWFKFLSTFSKAPDRGKPSKT